MKSQSSTPWISGLTPTDFSVLGVRLAPIKKRVIVIPALAKFTSESKILGMINVGAYVRNAAAPMKRKMNHGIATFAFASESALRYRNANNRAIGAIHNARASLTVVAVARASAPYA